MSTNKQRREAERARLQRQLEQRREREASHKRLTTAASIVGALVLVAGIVVVVAVSTSDSDKQTASKAGANANASASPSDSAADSQPSAQPSDQAQAQPPTPADPVLTKPCGGPSKGTTASFKGVKVTGATNLKKAPKLTSKGGKAPTTLRCQDLVVGKGPAAKPDSTANVRYVGVLYKDGSVFDSSWKNGKQPVPFPLSKVVPGFRLGIGGSGKVTPMHVGGRRLLILPPSLGYGSQANGPIPANSTLVFVADLTSLGS